MTFIDNNFSYITVTNPSDSSIYLSSGWSSSVWQFDSYPYIIININPYTKPNLKSFIDGNIYPKVAIPNSFTFKLYSDNGWDMERIWVINEGASRPRLIYRPGADLGIPLTHGMNYIYVVPHIKGTMNYMGLTWKSRGAFFRFPSPFPTGTLNQEVYYSIPDEDLEQHINNDVDGTVDVKWFASGVRDVQGAGGFSTYNNERTRKTKVNSQSSALVNFYFTKPEWIPTLSYKVSVSTPDGIVDISAVGSHVSSIRFTVNDVIKMGIPVVNVDDELASQVRVAMPDGIKALQVWTKYKHIPMLED